MSNYHPFTEQLATVLEKEPIYYRLLTSPQPTRRMNEVVESLALEGDPETPEMTLALFQSLGGDVPEVHLDRWLDRFREVAQRLYGDVLPEDKAEVTSKLLQAIYAEPRLYELVANVEPGYGLLEIVESLALEADETNLAQMLDLMFRLALE